MKRSNSPTRLRGQRTPEGTQRAAEAAAAANRLEDPDEAMVPFPLRLPRRLVRLMDEARGERSRSEYARIILENHHDARGNPNPPER